MFGMFGMIGTYEQRKVARTEIEDGFVSTARMTDTEKPFETGISHELYNEGYIVIVEQYDTKEEALAGHEKWVKVMEGKPEKLIDRGDCELLRFGSAMGVEVDRVHERKSRS